MLERISQFLTERETKGKRKKKTKAFSHDRWVCLISLAGISKCRATGSLDASLNSLNLSQESKTHRQLELWHCSQSLHQIVRGWRITTATAKWTVHDSHTTSKTEHSKVFNKETESPHYEIAE